MTVNGNAKLIFTVVISVLTSQAAILGVGLSRLDAIIDTKIEAKLGTRDVLLGTEMAQIRIENGAVRAELMSLTSIVIKNGIAFEEFSHMRGKDWEDLRYQLGQLIAKQNAFEDQLREHRMSLEPSR